MAEIRPPGYYPCRSCSHQNLSTDSHFIAYIVRFILKIISFIFLTIGRFLRIPPAADEITVKIGNRKMGYIPRIVFPDSWRLLSESLRPFSHPAYGDHPKTIFVSPYRTIPFNSPQAANEITVKIQKLFPLILFLRSIPRSENSSVRFSFQSRTSPYKF